MTKIIIVDNCTQCPYFFRFQNPKLGRVCLRVQKPDTKEFKTIQTKGDETPDWCPLQEKISNPKRRILDKYTVKLIHGLGRTESAMYADSVFVLPLKDWDQILKKVKLRRTPTGVEEI